MNGRAAASRTADLDVTAAPRRRRDVGAYLIGALAWAIGALSVGVMPTAIQEAGVNDSLLVAQLVGGTCLIVSMVASLVGAGRRFVTTLPAVGVLLAIGWPVAVVGLVVGHLEVIVLGAVIGGVGQAGGYRVALASITVGLSVIDQGKVAAGFSAFAYSGAGIAVVLDGVAAQIAGTIGGAVITGSAFAGVSMVAIAMVLLRRRRVAEGIPAPDPEAAVEASV